MENKEIEEELKNHEERIKKLEGYLPKQETKKIERKKSLRESFLEFNFKNEEDKTLFIMFSYEKDKNIIKFSTKEIKEGFHEMREKVPRNIADKFQRLHKAGWIMPCGKKDKSKFWKLTNSGEEHIKKLKKK